jgi:5'-methylthioadenosine phosphorylase
MTSVPEVVLAREAEMCYAGVSIVTNWAAGLAGQSLTHKEVVELMGRHLPDLRRLLTRVVSALDEDRDCLCQHAVGGQTPLGPHGKEGAREA